MEKKKIKWVVLLGVCVVVFTVCAIALIIHLMPRSPEPAPSPASSEGNSSQEPVLADNPVDFNALKAENPDIIGWISIPGCNIDYPVLQSADDMEEDYYLNHSREKKSSVYGAIYIQKLNSDNFSDPNTVIYGHNMLNGTMFGTLKKFRNKEFFEENQYIYIYTPGHILTYKLYSAFVYDDRHILNSFNFYNNKEYGSFLNQTLNPKSMVKNVREGVSVTTDDRIITLSTCTSVDTERYLVEGVLINDQLTK